MQVSPCPTATTALHPHHPTSTVTRMTVNVNLCGSMSRKDIAEANRNRLDAICSLRQITEERVSKARSSAMSDGSASSLTGHRPTLRAILSGVSVCDGPLMPPLPSLIPPDESGSSSEEAKTQLQPQQLAPLLPSPPPPAPASHKTTALAPLLEPPAWAVPAQGESRLEPACDALGRQLAVDLTRRACFRIGRSPHSDVQLIHGTSSRRHAMIFHHTNGSCYIVDAGSAHGTYVNGKRLPTPTGTGGVVVPSKVRRGSLIRFGGPGAPCFILKSFSFHLKDINKSEDAKKMKPSALLSIKGSSFATNKDEGELVRRNTRINALGKTAKESLRNTVQATIFKALAVTSRKRSFDSLSTRDTFDSVDSEDQQTQPNCFATTDTSAEGRSFSSADKRIRPCDSPMPSPVEPLRLVSPDIPSGVLLTSPPRRVSFDQNPPKIHYPDPARQQLPAETAEAVPQVPAALAA